MRIYQSLCDKHADLVAARSQRARDQIAESLTKAGARPVVVGLCQMQNHVGGMEAKQANLKRMIEAINTMSTAGVQVLVFPELCLPGYFGRAHGTPEQAADANRELADRVGDSRCLAALQAAARDRAMVIAFGFGEQADEDYFNAVGLVDADGTWVGTRRKNPLSPQAWELESFTEPEPAARSAVFTTRYGTFGLANCFDGEFAESIRRMRLDGAEVLLWCNAGSGDIRLGHSTRIHQAGSYAHANRMWVVCCNCVSEDTYGSSVIIGPSSEPLVTLPPDEQAFGLTTINLALSVDWDTWRQRLWLNTTGGAPGG